MKEAYTMDVKLIRDAAECSVRATQTAHPILALVDACNSTRICEDLLRRHQTPALSEAAGMDFEAFHKVMVAQKSNIMKSISEYYPELVPTHELAHYLGFIAPTEKQHPN